MCYCNKLISCVCAYVIPPLGVFWRFGLCNMHFGLALVLTICGYLPGVIYACYVIGFHDPVAGREPTEFYADLINDDAAENGSKAPDIVGDLRVVVVPSDDSGGYFKLTT
eukprot:gnl/MRDRNA2_/MRDRNA2_238673_c0_seq1.p1 gnl/MRDRNA2_/MRDRNA2_238673_c0~~gnl/MRDRNA2_/MRDRNA2_238673_c0_seq1.p1  ORF type:complete len:110 (-),score=7.04 gnl/MRDRNA2_/MRDRNA2_238673_c0_seq1:78-407(-)